jgi:hypothetical protein
MKRGDTVTTFSGRSGVVTGLLPGFRVAVTQTLYPPDGCKKPRPVQTVIIYRRTDVRVEEA